MTLLGQFALWGAFVFAAVAATMATLSGALRRPTYTTGAAWALAGAAVLTSAALGVLARVLIASDFAIRYVATFTAFSLPDAFKLGAIASGPPGVLLLWSTGLAIAAACAAHHGVREDARRGAMLVLALAVVVLFALTLCAIDHNPFIRVDPAPIDGLGMDPELQRGSILLATPLLLIGLGIATAAAVVGALTALSRPFSARIRGLLRQLAAATELTLVPGVLLGVRAASQVGTGGFRLWDQLHVGAVVVLVTAFVVSWVATPAYDAGLGGFARRVSIVGIAVTAIGIACFPLRTSADLLLRDGQSTTLTDWFGREWRFVSQGTSRFERPPNQFVLALSLAPTVGGRRVPLMTAEQREYVDGRGESRDEPVRSTGLSSGTFVDAQLALLDIGPGGAMVRITLWPLRALLAVGACVVWLGSLLRLVAALAATRDATRDAARAESEARSAAAEAEVNRWKTPAT
ncbi:MAG: hypothetical protein NTU67_03550 [Gemmatimonadetes bacterium]|nr:hypothetical protein [Gemmatimonadota bacterium]